MSDSWRSAVTSMLEDVRSQAGLDYTGNTRQPSGGTNRQTPLLDVAKWVDDLYALMRNMNSTYATFEMEANAAYTISAMYRGSEEATFYSLLLSEDGY